MTVLLVGGTGLLGGMIAAELVGRDEPIRALVRTGKRAACLRGLGIVLDGGDMRDSRALRRALSGIRVVVTTAQGDPLSRDRRIASIDGQGNLTLISAAAAAGVEHFIFISALKADEGAAGVPQLAHKYAAEQALIASGMTYTILRPSSFQETFGNTFAPFKRMIEQRGVGLTLGAGNGKHSFVAVRDVARTVRLALHHAEAKNAIIPIGGPEDLSYREAYSRIAQITGRRILIMTIPRVALRIGGAVMKPFLPDLYGCFALFALYERIGYTCKTPAWLVEALGCRRTFDEAVRLMYQPQIVITEEERAPAGD